MQENRKKYTNGEVTIVWDPSLCTHSGNCVRGLPRVFDVKRKPWIILDSASTEELVNQVGKCPSGALTCYMNEKK